MAIGGQTRGGVQSGGMNVMMPASGGGTWVVVNDNAETAQSSTDLLRPAAIDDSTFHWCKVGDGATRCLVRARMTADSNTVAQDPIIRVFGAYGTSINGDGSWPDTSAAATAGDPRFLRLDNVDWNAAGLTIDLVTDGAGMNRDATYAYSDVVPDLTGLDLKGCQWVGVAVQQAADVSTGTVPIEILFLN